MSVITTKRLISMLTGYSPDTLVVIRSLVNPEFAWDVHDVSPVEISKTGEYALALEDAGKHTEMYDIEEWKDSKPDQDSVGSEARWEFLQNQLEWMLRRAKRDLAEAVPFPNKNPTQDELVDQARWMACMFQANEELQANTQKDVAREIFAGTRYTITTEEELINWIDEVTDTYEQEVREILEQNA